MNPEVTKRGPWRQNRDSQFQISNLHLDLANHTILRIIFLQPKDLNWILALADIQNLLIRKEEWEVKYWKRTDPQINFYRQKHHRAIRWEEWTPCRMMHFRLELVVETSGKIPKMMSSFSSRNTKWQMNMSSLHSSKIMILLFWAQTIKIRPSKTK